MPILATVFWLVVTVHGTVAHKAGPMSADACALQMAFHIMQIDRAADAGVRVVIGGRVVKRGDVAIECKPGERGT